MGKVSHTRLVNDRQYVDAIWKMLNSKKAIVG